MTCMLINIQVSVLQFNDEVSFTVRLQRIILTVWPTSVILNWYPDKITINFICSPALIWIWLLQQPTDFVIAAASELLEAKRMFVINEVFLREVWSANTTSGLLHVDVGKTTEYYTFFQLSWLVRFFQVSNAAVSSNVI